MRRPSGILFSRVLFVTINMWLILQGNMKLEHEALSRKIKRVERLKGEVAFWNAEVEELDGFRRSIRVCHLFPCSFHPRSLLLSTVLLTLRE